MRTSVLIYILIILPRFQGSASVICQTFCYFPMSTQHTGPSAFSSGMSMVNICQSNSLGHSLSSLSHTFSSGTEIQGCANLKPHQANARRWMLTPCFSVKPGKFSFSDPLCQYREREHNQNKNNYTTQLNGKVKNNGSRAQ